MQEALYPVPQGGVPSTPPSRLLVGRADTPPVNPIPNRPLQGKPQDPLTVRLPILYQPPLPAGIALTSNIVLSGRPTDLSHLSVRSPFLVPLPPPVPPLVSTVIIRGSTQDLLTGLILPVRSPLLTQPPLPGGFFQTKLLLTGRVPADLPVTSVRGPSLVPLVTPIATSGVFDFWHYYSP